MRMVAIFVAGCLMGRASELPMSMAEYQDRVLAAWYGQISGRSSEQTRLLLEQGVKATETGHPRYNEQWFSIGPQFSADVYGMLAPGLPNLAGKLARLLDASSPYRQAIDQVIALSEQGQSFA